MKKTFKKLFYLLCITLLFGITSCSDDNKENGEGKEEQPKTVSELLASGGRLETLEEYNKEEVKIDTAQNTVAAYIDGVMQECYSIKTTRNFDVNTNPHDFVLYNPWTDVIWPGALIQGGSLQGDNVPANVPIYNKRIPGKIFLAIVSGNENMDEWYKETELRPANVLQAQNELMRSYLGNNTPAQTSYELKHVQSVEEMALKLGINLKLFGGKLKSDFGSNWNKKKNYVAVTLRQAFYTMTYEAPDGGLNGVFTDDIKVSDIKNYTGPGNPLCYVSSVTYGRTFVMLYESSYSSDSLFTALSVAFKKRSSDVTQTTKKIVNESKCTMTQLGGDPVAGLETVFGDFDKIKDFVVKGAKVSADNPGAPISFKINLVYDNSLVRMSNTLKYSVTEQTFSPIAPRNDVEINLFGFDMKAPDPDRGFTVSNHSRFEIKSIKAGHSKDGQFTILNGGKYTTFDDFKTESLALRNGYNVSIYRTAFLRSVPKDHKIRIEYEVYVKSQAYRSSSYKGERTYTLTRDFEYNTSNNTWEPIERNLTMPFESLSKSEKLGRTQIDFDLNFRFKCDNFVYPIR